jgi:Ca-activated chloride channel homolog
MRVGSVSSVGFLSILIAGAAAADGASTQVARANPVANAAASLRVDVNLALVPVTVMDPMGRNVLGLVRDNFRVYDGALPRPIVSFSRQDAPISVGLIFDCSRSMMEKFKVSREAPNQLFAQLNPADEAFLVTVSNRAVPRTSFTSNFEEIQNSLLFTHPDGSTSLLDGVYLGLQMLKHAHNPRKALVVVSDGGDNNSRYTMHELSELALESDAQIFTICLYYNPQTIEEARGPEMLYRMSELTGGMRFMISDVNRMRDAMSRIGVSLHNQYVLGVVPPPKAPAGKYRRIKVQLVVPVGSPRMQVFARSSYYVP